MSARHVSWILAAIAMLGAASAHAQVPAGSYAQSCSDVQVSGNVLHAKCKTMHGGTVDSSLNLPCRGAINNVNGKLACFGTPGGGAPPGSYLQSCSNARMENGALVANCRRANQTVVAASLTLPCSGGNIANLDGVLTCVANPPGSYSQSCSNAQVSGNVLQAKCRTMQGGMVDTSLNLPCKGSIYNVNGNLMCAGPAQGVPEGSYLHSCGGPRTQNGVLYASCRREDQTVAATTLQLPCNGRIENLNGVLTCR